MGLLTSMIGIASEAQVEASVAGAFYPSRYLKPAAALFETLPRDHIVPTSLTASVSGTLRMTAIALPAGVTVSSISFSTGSTGVTAPTNQWYGIFDDTRTLLGVTADGTNEAWNSVTVRTRSLVTPYVTTRTGLYYLGILVVASTPPTLWGVNFTINALQLPAPILGGNSTTGMTTPPALGFVADAFGGATPNRAYAYVS